MREVVELVEEEEEEARVWKGVLGRGGVVAAVWDRVLAVVWWRGRGAKGLMGWKGGCGGAEVRGRAG